MASWVNFVIIGLVMFTCMSNALQCSAVCDYDQDTRYANCSSRGLNCIPNNYPDADTMDLSSNEIDGISRRDFTRLQNVRVLNLDNNQIAGVLERYTFYELDEIEVVYMRNNFLTEIDLLNFKRPKLSSVFLDNNKIDSNGADTFISDVIEYLSLDYNDITNFDYSDIYFETLRHISLRFNDLDIFDMTLYESYVRWKSLRMDIDHNSLTSVDIVCYKFAVLDVSLNYYKLKSVTVRVRGFNQITLRLSLENIGLTNLDGLYITNSDDISLFLSHNKLRNLDMLQSIARALKYLTVDFNLIQTIPSDAFLDKGNLHGLSVIYNAIHAIEPEAFSGLNYLEYLDLRGNQITDLTFLDISLISGALENVEMGNNQLVCNESICNLYDWLLDHTPYYNTRCQYLGNPRSRPGSANLRRGLNITRAGCDAIPDLATDMTQVVNQRAATLSKVTTESFKQTPVTRSVVTVSPTRKYNTTFSPPENLPVLCQIKSNLILKCEPSNLDNIPEDVKYLFSDGTLSLDLGDESGKESSPRKTFDILVVTLPSVIGALLIEGVIFLIYLKLRKKEPQKDARVAYQKRSANERINQISGNDNDAYEDLGPRDVHVYESATIKTRNNDGHENSPPTYLTIE